MVRISVPFYYRSYIGTIFLLRLVIFASFGGGMSSQPTSAVMLKYTFDISTDQGDTHILDDKFLSFALDSSLLTKSSKEKQVLMSPRFRKLVKHLGPSYFRFGGTTSNLLYFDDAGEGGKLENTLPIGVHGADGDEIEQLGSVDEYFPDDVEATTIGQPFGGNSEVEALNHNTRPEDPKDKSLCRGKVVNNFSGSQGSSQESGSDYLVEDADCGGGHSKNVNKTGRERRQVSQFGAVKKKRGEKWEKHRTRGGGFNWVPMDHSFYDTLHNFTSHVGWDLVFTLGLLYGYYGAGVGEAGSTEPPSWDPSNVKSLLEYSRSRGYGVRAWQLGNEPNSFPHKFNVHSVGPERLADLFCDLKKSILGRDFSDYSRSLVAGPDVTKVMKIPKTAQPNYEKGNDKSKNTKGKKKAYKVPDPYSMAGKYLYKFLEQLTREYRASDGGAVIIDRLTWHHYYIDGRVAEAHDLVDPKILDQFGAEIRGLRSILDRFPPNLYNGIWMSEGGSAYGGGAQGLSDRYVAGFMFLDKLGLCGRNGIQVFIRQSLYQGRYGLIGSDLTPNPDYWTAVLFKRLVGPVAFAVTVKKVDVSPRPQSLFYNTADLFESLSILSSLGTEPENDVSRSHKTPTVPGSKRGSSDDPNPIDDLRIYAHCVNPRNAWYSPGTLVLYVLNLNNQTASARLSSLLPNKRLTGHLGPVMHTYLLTPSGGNDDYEGGSVNSRLSSHKIALNGITLELGAEGELPPMKPKISIINSDPGDSSGDDRSLDIVLPPLSYGFFLYPKANFEPCLKIANLPYANESKACLND